MRRLNAALVATLSVSLSLAGVPSAFAAGQSQDGKKFTVEGVTQDSRGVIIASRSIQLRDGRCHIFAKEKTNDVGQFKFFEVPPGDYLIELLGPDATKDPKKASAKNDDNVLVGALPVTVKDATVSGMVVTGGLDLYGHFVRRCAAGAFLLTPAGAALLGALGAGSLAAVVATRPDSSPIQ